MTIHDRLVSDIAVISISGRVTLTDGTAAFDETVQRLIQQGHVKMILDFAEYRARCHLARTRDRATAAWCTEVDSRPRACS